MVVKCYFRLIPITCLPLTLARAWQPKHLVWGNHMDVSGLFGGKFNHKIHL
jgi:hypothetical protein